MEAVNQTLNDIWNPYNNVLFGQIPIPLASNFVQIAPIILNSNQASTVCTSLQSSFHCPNYQILHLTLNMQAQAGLNNIFFPT